MISPTDSPTSGSPAATQSNTSRPSLRLRFRGGQHNGQVVRINSAKCTIGSAPHATLRLACPGVHPIHCVILSGSDATAIRSVAPDTLLNGNPFEDEQLKPGDVLSVGPLHLEILNTVAACDSVAAESTQQSDETQALRAELDAVRQQLATERTQNQELSQQLTSVTDQLRDEAARASELAAHSSDAASQFAELSALREQVTQVDTLLQDKQDLAEQVTQLQEQLGESQTAKAKYEADFASVAEKLNDLEATQAAYEQLIREVEQLRLAVEEAEEHRQQWEIQRTQLEEELATTQQQLTQQVADDQEAEPEPPQQPFAHTEEPAPLFSNTAPPEFPEVAAEAPEVIPETPEIVPEVAAAEAPVAASLDPFPHEAQDAPENLEQFAAPTPNGVQNSDESFGVDQASPASPSSADATMQLAEEVDPPSTAQNATVAMDGFQLGEATQTMNMDDFLSASDAAQAEVRDGNPEPNSTDTVSQTMIFEQSSSFENTPQDDAMAMLDKLRAELGVSTPQSDPPVEETAPYSGDAESEDLVLTEEDPDAHVPATPEEIEYSEPDSSAPVDTAAILAKFGHSPEPMDLDGPSDPPAPQPIVPPPASADEDEDGSIQDYMAQLMQRVGGGETAPVTQQVAPKPAAKPAAAPKDDPKPSAPDKSEPAAKPLDPSEFVPRAVAPEATSGLKALRAVANTSTRSAINRHQRRSLDSKAIISGFVALVAFAVAVAMGYLALDAESWVSIPMMLSLSSGFIGILAAVKALAFSARAALTSRRQQNLKQLSAR